MSNDPILLRALTVEEVAGFRQALIDDLRSAELRGEAGHRDLVFPNGMTWSFEDVLEGTAFLAVPAAPQEPPAEVNWCGSIGCAMGRMPAIPEFREEGFAAVLARCPISGWTPTGVSFAGRDLGLEHDVVGAHFLGIHWQDFRYTFWGGVNGQTPREIADWLDGLSPAEAQPAREWSGDSSDPDSDTDDE